MTIDEAISHAREVAEEKRKSKSVNLAPEIISECELCAQEHEQLAEWLEEFARIICFMMSERKLGYNAMIQ